MARLFVANVQKGEESPVAGLGQLLLEDRAREQKLALEQQEAERRSAKDAADIEFRNASLDHEKDVQRERERANKEAEQLKRDDMKRRREEEVYKLRFGAVQAEKDRKAKKEIAELGAETQIEVTEKRGETQIKVAELGADERRRREDKALQGEKKAQGLAAKEFYSNSERSVKGYDPVDRPNRSQLQQFGKRYNAVQDRIANAETEEELAEAVLEVSTLRADFKAMLDRHDDDLEEKKGQAAYDQARNMASAPYEEGGAGLTEDEIANIVVGANRKDDTKELLEAAQSRRAFRRAEEELNNAKLNNSDWVDQNLQPNDDGIGLKDHGEDTYLGDLDEILRDPNSSEAEKTRAMTLMSRAIRMGAANPDASQLIQDMDGQRRAQTERKVQGQKNQEFLAGLGMQMLPEADFALQATEYLIENEEGLAMSPDQARAAQKVNNIIKETLRDYAPVPADRRREPGGGRRRKQLAETPNEEILKRLQQAVESGEIAQEEFSSIMQFMTRGVLTQNAEELGDVPTFEAWMQEAFEYEPPPENIPKRFGQIM